MESAIIFVHVLAAIGIIGLVLIQHGKGADMGASFGSGASQTIFGSVGTGNALTKSTSWLATVFFITSLVLALIARQQTGQSIEDDGLIENAGVLTETPAATVQDVPVAAGTTSDIPQTATAEETAEAPAIDEALQAALEQAAALAAEEAANQDAPAATETTTEGTTEEADSAADATEEPAQ